MSNLSSPLTPPTPASTAAPINPHINRRQHERFELRPMYTSLKARPMDRTTFRDEGHAYNISEGGVCFELDRAYEPGTMLALQVDLPSLAIDPGPGRAIYLVGRVVWVDEDEAPGPVRMALSVHSFPRAGDRERLLAQFGARVLKRAA